MTSGNRYRMLNGKGYGRGGGGHELVIIPTGYDLAPLAWLPALWPPARRHGPRTFRSARPELGFNLGNIVFMNESTSSGELRLSLRKSLDLARVTSLKKREDLHLSEHVQSFSGTIDCSQDYVDGTSQVICQFAMCETRYILHAFHAPNERSIGANNFSRKKTIWVNMSIG